MRSRLSHYRAAGGPGSVSGRARALSSVLGVRSHVGQAASRIPSAIAIRRMWCKRRVAVETCWHMRDRQRKFRSSSWLRQCHLAEGTLLKPKHRPTSHPSGATLARLTRLELALRSHASAANGLAHLGPAFRERQGAGAERFALSPGRERASFRLHSVDCKARTECRY